MAKPMIPMIQNVNQENDPMLESTPLNQIPMYQHGGDVPKDQVAHVDAGERVLNPTEAHAYHSAAAGEAPPTLLGRIATRAHELYNQGMAFTAPLDSEQNAIKEKQQHVNDTQHQMSTEMQPPAPTNYAPVAADRVHPGATYGSRPGEQRIDTSSMMKPLGAAPTMAKLPSYDEGGDVPEDQTAQLGEGEHVLDPKKAAAYRQAEAEVKAEHGAPADFAGQVMENPKGIKVQSDTDRSMAEPQRLTGGASMNTKLAPLGNTKMDKENTPITQIDSGAMSDASAKAPLGDTGAPRSTAMRPLPTIETPMGNGTTDVPMGETAKNEASAENAGATVQHQAPNPEHAALIAQDKEEAAKKGDLVGLGKAMINENLFVPKRDNPQMPVTPTAPSPEENRTNQIAELRNKMINGQTETERFQAERDLAELKRKTPWGSPENHPGTLGKILHGVSSIAQGAAQGVAPYVLPSIPGSQANLAQSEARGEQGVEQSQGKEMKAAQLATEQQKPELKEQAAEMAEQKLTAANNSLLRKQGLKVDAAGHQVPLTYEEMSLPEQGAYDLQQAKSAAQNSISELKDAQADPNSPANQAIIARAKEAGQKVDIAAQKVGIDAAKFKADYLGLGPDNNPLPGAALTPEGKPIGPKMMPKGTGKPTANQTMKADLAENVIHNVDEATKLIRANPGLFGKVAGRFTTVSQMTGSDDPAIAKLGLILHNTALATNGIHGLRSAQAIEGTEKELLNKFKNSPEATIAALKENRRSVGDFMKDGGKTMIPDPDLVPAGASAEVTDKDGNVTGHVVNNKYVALPKE